MTQPYNDHVALVQDVFELIARAQLDEHERFHLRNVAYPEIRSLAHQLGIKHGMTVIGAKRAVRRETGVRCL